MSLEEFRLLIYILDPFADTFWPPSGPRPVSQSASFDRVAVIEEYVSCIWTERFIEAGDFKLVTVATGTNAKLIRPGVVLENDQSSIPMLIETIELKDNNLIATGRTIETFFNERSIGPYAAFDSGGGGPLAPLIFTDSPGRIMGAIVEAMQTHGNGDQVIYGIRAGSVQADGDDVTKKLPKREKVYDLLLRIAKQFVVDMYVRRNPIEYGGFEFVFSTRKGVRRVDGNSDGYPTVRFTPKDDNLVGVTEIYSAIGTADAVMVYPPQAFMEAQNYGYYFDYYSFGYMINGDNIDSPDGVSDFDNYNPSSDDNNPFESRTIIVDSDKLTIEYLEKQLYRYGYEDWDWADVPTIGTYNKRHIIHKEMIRLGKAEYNRSRGNRKWAIDGEAASNVFKFGRDYRLGDIVEVTGRDFLLGDGTEGPVYVDEDNPIFGKREAMVSEYIRSADETGTREYPTFSEPLKPAPYDDSPEEQQTIGPNR